MNKYIICLIGIWLLSILLRLSISTIFFNIAPTLLEIVLSILQPVSMLAGYSLSKLIESDPKKEKINLKTGDLCIPCSNFKSQDGLKIFEAYVEDSKEYFTVYIIDKSREDAKRKIFDTYLSSKILSFEEIDNPGYIIRKENK